MTTRLTKAIRGNLIAWLALFVALGGTSLAASHYVINSSKQISPKVLKKLKGNRGATGPRGLQGAPGTVDTSTVFNRTESDGRYLGKGAQAADSAKLGGVAAAGYTTGEGSQGGRWLEMIDKGVEPNFLFVPSIGELALECSTAVKATNVQLVQHAGGPVFLTWGTYGKGVTPRMKPALLKSDGDSAVETFAPGTEEGTGQMIIQASSVSTPVHVYATITVSAAVTEEKCRFQANYTVAQQRF